MNAALATRRAAAVAVFIALAASACGSRLGNVEPVASPSPTVRATAIPLAELVRSGKLRVAFNNQNITLIQCSNAAGTLIGVGADMATELARVMRVRASDTCYTDNVALFDAGRRGEWDVAFVVADPGQAGIEFTRPYVLIEQTYFVPARSPVQTVADVDRLGLRVALFGGNALDRFLTQTLKSATIVRTGSTVLAIAEVEAGRADVVAASRDDLERVAAAPPPRLPGGRILPDTITGNPWVVAVAGGRADLFNYVDDFVEHAKVIGFVRGVVGRNNLRGAVVPAPGP